MVTLQKLEINKVFKTFLSTEDPIELDSASKISGHESCVKQGWIYEEPSDINELNQSCILASPHLEYFVFPSKTELGTSIFQVYH